jgi:hypothetical protein
MDVIQRLNQIGTIRSNSIRIQRSDLSMIFHLNSVVFGQSVQYKSCAKYSTLPLEKVQYLLEVTRYFY